MKKLKKVVAIALAAVMSLAILTGCSDNGRGGGIRPGESGTVESTQDAHEIIEWVIEAAAEMNVHLEEDQVLNQAIQTEINYEIMIKAAAARGATAEEINELEAEKNAKVEPMMNGKHTYGVGIGADSKTNRFEKNATKQGIKAMWTQIVQEVGSTPTKIGGVVYKFEDGKYMCAIILSDK